MLGFVRKGCVAQVSNLLYRRLPVGRLHLLRRICGLEIRDTADWKSALPPAVGDTREISGLTGFCAALLLAAALSSPAAEPSAPPSFPGADLFTNGAVERISIVLKPEDEESLRRQPREFVPATVSAGATVYSNVAVHLKGAVGSFRPLDNKPALTLDFCRLLAGRRFHGLRRIHLNNSVEDPSYVNEKLGSELFRAAGVPAPRVSRAWVSLDGRALGLYVLKEGFTEDFLAGYFKQVSGDLFEPGDGHDVDERLKRNTIETRGAGILPAFPSAPSQGLSRNTRNRASLRALAAAAHEPDPARRWARLEQTLDVQRFVAFMAMEVILCHRDGYCLARNNFRVYHDLDTGKVVFFPHGMDQLLGKADFPCRPFMAGLVARAVLETPEGKARYEAALHSLFTNLFKPEVLVERVGQLTSELRPFLTRREFNRLEQETALVKQRIVERHRDLAEQLSRPELELTQFQAGLGRPEGWVAVEAPAGGTLDRAEGSGGLSALHIVAGPQTLASWRARVLLEPGRYRFEGRAKVAGVKPLPSGRHQCAGLRIGGGLR
ncbi:MAG TPA: CotH kinase family protein, partial [Dongiaceae bacterium]|nr:CotH kinase family protein [Dongiaceae bacterium]